MRVFRLCRENEVKKILGSNEFEDIGNYCRNSEKNTHRYDEDIKYLHFFKKQEDLLYLNTLASRFICVYDIPSDLLSRYHGYGKYRDYIKFVTLNEVEEFAIPSKLIKFEYLLTISRIISDIDIEDMLENSNLDGITQKVYNRKMNR